MASVLFVCTANRIRSPLAEASLRRALGSAPIQVVSAGARAGPAMGAIPEAVIAAERLGLDLSGHSSRALSEIHAEDFDLVVGFELSNVASAVVEGGSSLEKTFLLKEIVRLATETEAREQPGPADDRLRALVAAADRLRSPRRSVDPSDAIPDPIGRGQAAADNCAQEIESCCISLARMLGLPG